MAIDWDFIGSLEGNSLMGYVPDGAGSMSGVTVASGFDLGQRRDLEVVRAFPDGLGQRLAPYCGLKGRDASRYLESRPLSVTADEAHQINAYAHSNILGVLAFRFNHERHILEVFEALPDAVQTVLASVAFQYGSPWVKTPHFWGYALVGNWPALSADLRHFGDRYQSRHDREAAYLDEHLKMEWTNGRAGVS